MPWRRRNHFHNPALRNTMQAIARHEKPSPVLKNLIKQRTGPREISGRFVYLWRIQFSIGKSH